MAGRKPLMLGHVRALCGSAHAKQWMIVFLKTMRGELRVAEACQELGIAASRFHAARQEWLKESLKLLEPRPVGRPPKRAPVMTEDVARLRRQVEEQEEELRAAAARLEVARILNRGPTEPPGKTAGEPRAGRRPR